MYIYTLYTNLYTKNMKILTQLRVILIRKKSHLQKDDSINKIMYTHIHKIYEKTPTPHVYTIM